MVVNRAIRAPRLLRERRCLWGMTEEHAELLTGEIITFAAFCTDVLERRFRYAYAAFVQNEDNPRRLSVEMDEAPWHFDWSRDNIIWNTP